MASRRALPAFTPERTHERREGEVPLASDGVHIGGVVAAAIVASLQPGPAQDQVARNVRSTALVGRAEGGATLDCVREIDVSVCLQQQNYPVEVVRVCRELEREEAAARVMVDVCTTADEEFYRGKLILAVCKHECGEAGARTGRTRLLQIGAPIQQQ